MNIPRSEYDELLAAFRQLSHNHSFAVVMKWIQNERDARDRENRVPGFENKTSESMALSKILEVYAAAISDG